MHIPDDNLTVRANAFDSPCTISEGGEPSRVAALIAPFNATDIVLLCTLSISLYPLYKVAHLPFAINLTGILVAFWVGTAVTGTMFAVVFALVGIPMRHTIGPFARRLKRQKGAIVITIILVTIMFAFLGAPLGFVLTVDALAVAELLNRSKRPIGQLFLDLVVPASYLFLEVLFVLAYNHAVPAMRNPASYDAFLNRADQVLFRVQVSDLVTLCLDHAPHWYMQVLQVVYFGMFGGIGGTMILLSILQGRRAAVRLIRTILICSVLSLFVYICMPAIGPWIHPTLHREAASFLFPTFGTQQMILQRANLLWSHTISPEVTRVDVTDAFVSFPSLHIAVPFIAIWFLRDYKRLFGVCLTVYVCLLVPSVVLLEWHYIVDVVGGLVTAVLAIWFSSIVAGPDPGHRRTGDQCDSSLHSI